MIMDDDTFIDAFDANYQSEFQDSTVTIECSVLDTNNPPINPSFSDAPFPLQYVRNARVVPDIFHKPHNFQTQISKDKPFRDELSSQKVAKYTFDQLWTEKYRPTRISDLVGNEQAILELVKWVSEWKVYFESSSKNKIPDSNIVLISGPPGIGKTTLATVAVKNANFFPLQSMRVTSVVLMHLHLKYLVVLIANCAFQIKNHSLFWMKLTVPLNQE